MRYLSVCSGIEAATVAWHPLGWEPVAFAETDRFPSAVLAHHYPTVPNRGDMTKFREWDDTAFDVLVGGTPCQSFSVAGLRAGLADPRGSLLLTYLAITGRYRPRWLVWENVAGVLSIDDGRAFGSMLGGLGELGYGVAYRVLDAQHFGLAQRRARVFVVGCLGDWRRAAAVLFERASLSGHPAPRREAGQSVAPSVTVGAPFSRTGNERVEADAIVPVLATEPVSFDWQAGGGGSDKSFRGKSRSYTVDKPGRTSALTSVKTLAVAFDARQSDVLQYGDKSGPLDTDGHTIVVAFHENQRAELTTNDTAGSLKVGGGKPGQGYPAVAFQESQSGFRACDSHPTLDSHNGSRRHHGVMAGMQVRRLTPRECERLQGFPDDYTLIPYRGKLAADGPRYKALGNSMAVPVMHWIGKRIARVDRVERVPE